MLDSDIIIGHSLVPKHEIMSNASVERVLKHYKITTEQLPKIKADDPVVTAIGAKKGQVLKITRNSITAGKAVYYRVVV